MVGNSPLWCFDQPAGASDSAIRIDSHINTDFDRGLLCFDRVIHLVHNRDKRAPYSQHEPWCHNLSCPDN